MAKTKKSPVFPKHPSARVSLYNSQRTIPISKPSAEAVAQFLLGASGQKEMALHFVGKAKISQLHKLFFDDPSPTDCITLPFNDPQFLGEVYVCPAVAAEYVASKGGDLYEEITLYVVHGFCHLLGFEDQTETQRQQIRREEKKWLQKLAKNSLTITP